jgi:DNA-binding NarL/FixJ family response regulator
MSKDSQNHPDSIIKISIIEDSEIHREWLKTELSENPRFDIVSVDNFGRKGIESVRLLEPHLVILDFQLEDVTGLEVSKRIKAYNDSIKIFVLTAHIEISIVERLINDKNIDAIAIKGSHYFENNFLSAIDHVIDGGTYLDPSLLRKLRESKNLSGLSKLTKREFEIFIQASSGKTDSKIAEDLHVELAHVKNIKSRVAKKIKGDDIDNLLSRLAQNSNSGQGIVSNNKMDLLC